MTDVRSDVLEVSNARAAIAVDPAGGGRLVSLVVDGEQLLGGSAPVPGLPAGIFSGSFLMTPWVGRMRDGLFTFEGVEYRMPVDAGDTAIHGLVFDQAWTVESAGGAGDPVRIGVDLPDAWPFGGRVTQEYALTDTSLTITATVSNDERSMPAVAGFHPWLTDRLSDGTPGTFEFVSDKRYVTDGSGIPTGEFDAGEVRPWDDSFLGTASAPVVHWGERTLTVEDTGTHWIVCETNPGGFCIEPMSGPVNGLVTGECAIVSPGHPLVQALTWRWD